MDITEINEKIKNIKKNLSDKHLQEEEIKKDPFEQFILWLNETLQSSTPDPLAMVLATVDEEGIPDTRVVLLKELENNKLIFYSNYNSNKAKQLVQNNHVAINFYWPQVARQIRIRGRVEKIEHQRSEVYFATRPRESQLSVYAWMQSMILPNRKDMDKRMSVVEKKFADKPIPCPEYWGGYAVTPFEYEFFQSRSWRMHDRLLYTIDDNKIWHVARLAP